MIAKRNELDEEWGTYRRAARTGRQMEIIGMVTQSIPLAAISRNLGIDRVTVWRELRQQGPGSDVPGPEEMETA